MTIEFHCPHCDKFLKTPDDKAGRRADCPGCGEPVTVPEISEEQYLGETLPYGGEVDYSEASLGPVETAATKACPMCGGEIKAAAVKCRHCGEEFGRLPGVEGEIVPTVIDIGEVLGTTWRIFKAEMGMCLAVILVVFVLNFGLSFFLGLIQAVAGVNQQMEVMIGVQAVTTILTWVFQFWLALGQMIFFLNIARGKPAAISDIFSGGRYLGTMIGASILFFLMVFGASLLVVIPGIIVALMFGQYQYLIIDQSAGILESLNLSREITTGNKWNIFVLGMASVGIMMLGVLACGIGALFSTVYITLMVVVAYLRMTGQPTAT